MSAGAAVPEPSNASKITPREAFHTLTASFLGWTLDAFDFFVLVMVLPAVAKDFGVSIADVAFTLTITLAFRPIGALVFGWMADRYGRRTPLMIDIIFYSVVEVLSGLAPTYMVFLVLRALYGIGMGGEWGVGSSLAMEAIPKRRRGLFSGILQEGYAVGYLLAAAAYFFIFPYFGWRAMFFVGGLPALLTIYIRTKVPESKTWERTRPNRGQILLAIRSNLSSFLYLVVFMTAMSLISHGTQDMYPTFLEKQRGLTPRAVAAIVVIYQLGALVGGLVFGYVSDLIGRRRAIASAAMLGALLVPLWIYPSSIIVLTIGAFLMQFMVQGAWGVIPAHLAEVSPPQARGLYSGLAYQLGVLFGGSVAYVEALLSERYGYTTALAVIAAGVLSTAAIVTLFGRERHGVELHAAPEPAD